MGEAVIVNLGTGEVVGEGVFRTHEQIKASRAYFEDRAKEKFILDTQYESQGNFVWFLYNANKVLNLGVKPESLTKLIFLSTYMGYDNKLMATQKTAMNKITMLSLLKVKRATFFSFYKEMVESHIFVERGGDIYLSDILFSKGDIKRTDTQVNKMRLYSDGIRETYTKATVREHKTLSYLFQAIPFINLQYNIICYNPYEDNIKNIKRMTVTEFCNIISYDVSQSSRLKRNLKSVRVDDMSAFGFVETEDNYNMFINPNLYYAGDIWSEVRVLGAFHQKRDR